ASTRTATATAVRRWRCGPHRWGRTCRGYSCASRSRATPARRRRKPRRRRWPRPTPPTSCPPPKTTPPSSPTTPGRCHCRLSALARCLGWSGIVRLDISKRPERQNRGMAEFIYTMKKVRKAHGDKVILDDVTLSFYPGAKIGVVGPNGAGKSSVLRIMAGLDKPNNGEAFLANGATVGILQQEPPLNEEKTVRGNVEEGLGDIKVKLDRFNEVAELMATDYSDELMEEMGRLQEDLDHANAWDLDSQLEQAMDALRCPPPDDPVTNLSAAEQTRPAAPRRADQPPGRRERAVARIASRQLCRCDSGGHPRPVLPGQR